MRKTPEMRRREAKRKVRLAREKAYREFRDRSAAITIRVCKALHKLASVAKATVVPGRKLGESFEEAKKQLTKKATRQFARLGIDPKNFDKEETQIETTVQDVLDVARRQMVGNPPDDLINNG